MYAIRSYYAQGKTKHLLSVGYLPENNPLYPDMIVREYLEYAVGFYPAQTINPGRIDEIISITGLERVVSKLSGSLSKGYVITSYSIHYTKLYENSLRYGHQTKATKNQSNIFKN